MKHEIFESNDNIETINDEVNDYYSNDDLYTINSWGADLSFRELITMKDDNEMVKPELQRKFVWDRTEASGFIDSVLLGLPVPSIFLAKTTEEKYLIIDGYQRITTVFDFVKGVFSQDNKVFKLANSEKINKKWRGKAFIELEEKDQRRIKNTTIHAIIFEQIHPSENNTSLFQIFERINTTGRTLYPQEIRNCVYQGSMNSLLLSLNGGEIWRKLFGQKEEDLRMRDMEYILRFLALSSDDFSSSKIKSISLKKYLNEFMGNSKNNTKEQIAFFTKYFNNMIDKVFEILGTTAFNNISKKNNEHIPKFHPTIFDAISISTAYAIDNNFDFKSINDYKKRHINLLKDENFTNYISIRTTNREHISGRIKLACEHLYGLKYEQQ